MTGACHMYLQKPYNDISTLADNEAQIYYRLDSEQKIEQTLLRKPGFVCHSPCVQRLPKLRDDRLIDMSTVCVNLLVQQIKQQPY